MAKQCQDLARQFACGAFARGRCRFVLPELGNNRRAFQTLCLTHHMPRLEACPHTPGERGGRSVVPFCAGSRAKAIRGLQRVRPRCIAMRSVHSKRCLNSVNKWLIPTGREGFCQPCAAHLRVDRVGSVACGSRLVNAVGAAKGGALNQAVLVGGKGGALVHRLEHHPIKEL